MSERCQKQYCDMVMAYCLGQSDVEQDQKHILEQCQKCIEGICDRCWSHAQKEASAQVIDTAVHRGKERLMRLIQKAEHRFATLVPAFAEFLQIPEPTVNSLLSQMDTPQCWEPTGLSHVALLPITGFFQKNKRLTFMKVCAQNCTPEHSHQGDMQYYILSGAHKARCGTLFGPGYFDSFKCGEMHSICATQERDLVLAILTDGFELHF